MGWCAGKKKCKSGYACTACQRCGHHCICDPPSKPAILTRRAAAAELSSELESQRLEIARLRASNERLRRLLERHEPRHLKVVGK